MSPIRSALPVAELEAVICLALQAVPGCSGISKVKVAREIRKGPNSPNWDVSEIGEFPPAAEVSISRTVERLRQKFDLVTG